MKLKPIEDQVVALMGASSGIGREAALRFVGRGAKVVVSAHNEGDLRSLVEEIRGTGGEATAVTAEVTAFGQVEAVARRAVEEHGRLDTPSTWRRPRSSRGSRSWSRRSSSASWTWT